MRAPQGFPCQIRRGLDDFLGFCGRTPTVNRQGIPGLTAAWSSPPCTGPPIEPRNFNRSFDRRVRRAGVSKITVHGARKTCGSLLTALDLHPRVAMQILRHSKIAATMEIYTEIPSAATRDALRKLGRWLGE